MGLLDFFKRKKNNDDEDIDIDDDTESVGMEDNPDGAILAEEFDESLPPEVDANLDDVELDLELEENSDQDLSIGNGDELEIDEFGDDGFDDDDGVDPKSDDEQGRKSSMKFVFAGIAVLLLGGVGGAGYWYLASADSDPIAEHSGQLQSSDRSFAMAIPTKKASKSGGLNALGASGLTPPEERNATRAPEKVPAPASAPTKEVPEEIGLSSITGGAAEGGSLNAAAGKAIVDTGQGLVVPSVTSVSYRKLPDQTKVIPLASAPIKQLLELEPIDNGNRLPIIGPKGRLPWQVYARPFIEKTANPKVAFIVKGLGFSRAATMAAIKKLPGEVSLAFSPYVPDLNDWMLRARLSGHEVFLELPMESANFPAEDAGPLALNTQLQVKDNIHNLNLVMSKMSGYVGLLSIMGSKFNKAEGQLLPVLKEIKNRGLMFVDGGGGNSEARKIASKIELPRAFSNVYLDEPPSRRAMDQKLQRLDKLVRQQAAAVAIVHAYPNTIERLLIWIKSMEQRKLTLVPVSNLANKQIIQ